MAEVELGFLVVGGEFDVFLPLAVFHSEFVVRSSTDGDRYKEKGRLKPRIWFSDGLVRVGFLTSPIAWNSGIVS